MVEHVRRRALMANGLGRVVVATCDDEIEDVVRAGGGDIVRTGNHHTNGTSRAAEAAEQLDCSRVVLLQGDEPLLLPSHIDTLIDAGARHPSADAWNITGPIGTPGELDRHSFVKCAVAPDHRILYCFRRSPSAAPPETQTAFIRKILGLFAYKAAALRELVAERPTPIEVAESIEQMRLLETGRTLISVPVDAALPSVNEPEEAELVLQHVHSSDEQKRLLARVLEQG